MGVSMGFDPKLDQNVIQYGGRLEVGWGFFTRKKHGVKRQDSVTVLREKGFSNIEQTFGMGFSSKFGCMVG